MSTMPQAQAAAGTGYVLRTTTPADLGGARAVMLDTVYRDLRSGYVPRRHADIIDPDTACLRPDRCTLLVVECEGEIVATGAVRDRGPQAPGPVRWAALAAVPLAGAALALTLPVGRTGKRERRDVVGVRVEASPTPPGGRTP